MLNIRETKTKKLRWIDIINANKDNLKFLREEFNFDSADLNECLPNMERPKIIERDDYIFIVLQFPAYYHETQTIEPAEIDFFIGKKYLVVCHSGELTPLNDFFYLCQSDQLMHIKLEGEEPLTLYYKISDKLYNYCYPIINDINLDLTKAEKFVLGQAEEKTIKHILLTKRNIVDFQRIMQSHLRIAEKILELSGKKDNKKTTKKYSHELISHIININDSLKNYKDTINAIHETQESMTNLKINEIMKTLTIFSVVVFPLTLLAAIFGMNTVISMPFIDHPHGFWYIIGMMIGGAIMMFGYFKKKGWL